MTLIAALFLTTTLNLPARLNTLVLRSGHQIAVDGPVREDNGRIIFRGADGMLYSLAATDVDVNKTRSASSQAATAAPSEGDRRVKLRVSDSERERLLRELERNHSGQPAPESFILSHPPQPMTPASSLASEREMTIRWIWLVPSKICMTLASRM